MRLCCPLCGSDAVVAHAAPVRRAPSAARVNALSCVACGSVSRAEAFGSA